MRGRVIGFDPDRNAGAIAGDDGQRYDFSTGDWRGQGRPKHGDAVDFIAEGARAAQVHAIEPEHPKPNLLQFYVSPRGRISRSQYWLWYIVPVIAISVVLSGTAGVAAAAGEYGTAAFFQFIYSLFGFLTLWPGIAVLIKRIHDRDKSGWLILLPFVTGVLVVIAAAVGMAADSPSSAGIFAGVMAVALIGISIWFFIEFGLMRGTIGPNRYGPDPVVAR